MGVPGSTSNSWQCLMQFQSNIVMATHNTAAYGSYGVPSNLSSKPLQQVQSCLRPCPEQTCSLTQASIKKLRSPQEELWWPFECSCVRQIVVGSARPVAVSPAVQGAPAPPPDLPPGARYSGTITDPNTGALIDRYVVPQRGAVRDQTSLIAHSVEPGLAPRAVAAPLGLFAL